MKRLLLLAAVGAAASLVPAPAQASHLCVTSGGSPVWCAPHPAISRPRICVTSGGSNVVCV